MLRRISFSSELHKNCPVDRIMYLILQTHAIFTVKFTPTEWIFSTSQKQYKLALTEIDVIEHIKSKNIFKMKYENDTYQFAMADYVIGYENQPLDFNHVKTYEKFDLFIQSETATHGFHKTVMLQKNFKYFETHHENLFHINTPASIIDMITAYVYQDLLILTGDMFNLYEIAKLLENPVLMDLCANVINRQGFKDCLHLPIDFEYTDEFDPKFVSLKKK